MNGGMKFKEHRSAEAVKSASASGPMRIGDVLVGMGVLTPAQRDAVLEAQRVRHRPFGVLAEEMFDVSPETVESAWASQFSELAPHVDPAGAPIPKEALAAISRRQAWQFRVLPLWFSGDELVVATTRENLARAMRFVAWRIERPVSFVIAEPRRLGEALCEHYPMAGMTPDDVVPAAVVPETVIPGAP